MKGKNEQKAKWSGSVTEKRREAKRQKIDKNLKAGVTVEIIPARSELEPEQVKTIRVAAYCRVSTDQDAQTTSYEYQVDHFQKLVAANPEWELVDIYADEGLSGTNAAKRKDFQRMITDCKAGKIDMVLTKDIRRFARNTLDCLYYVRLLKNLDPPVAVYFEGESLNTLDAKQEAVLALLSSVAQGESENKSEAIKWSYRHRFSNGIPMIPTWVLLGYTTDEYGNMVIVPDEAEVVSFIYEKYLDGWTVKEIAAHLTKEGIPTVKGLDVWPVGSVYNILRNEKYCGDVLMQKTYTPNCLTHRVVKNRGQVRQYRLSDHHPAIVSREVWLEVQQCLSSGKRRRRHSGKTSKPLSKIRIETIKGGNFKGWCVFNPDWPLDSISAIVTKLKTNTTREGVTENA